MTPWERSPACPLSDPHLAGGLSGLSVWPGAQRCSEEGTSDLPGVALLLPWHLLCLAGCGSLPCGLSGTGQGRLSEL